MIKIVRKLVKTPEGAKNHIGIRAKVEVLLVILGKPHARVERGRVVYTWPERGLSIRWNGFGFFEVEGSEEYLPWLLEHIVERIKKYNETIKYAFYGCKNDTEWAIIKGIVGENRLLVYIDRLQFINSTGGKRQIHEWSF
jgi:hypothetical protein